MAGVYSWITFLQCRQQLAARLADPTMQFWSDAELKTYIIKALRMFNCLTSTWKKEFVFNNAGPGVWNSLATLTGSPRLRSVTDTQCYVDMEYMLLELPSGGTWSGTNQFNISDLSQALQRRRDEMLVISACNDVLVTGIPLTPNTSRTLLSDNSLDVPRLRYIPVGSTGNSGVTLYRDDAVALEFYDAPLYQLPPQQPQTYSLSSEPPLSFDVYPPPNLPGTYEAVVLQSGLPFNPPASTLIGIPDDLVVFLEYGALADLLGRESEAKDTERAEYAQKRYMDGLLLLQKTPWIMLGKVNGQAVSCDSLFDLDRFDPEWDSNPTGFGPVIVTAGVDFFAAPTSAGIGLTCLASAPIPTLDSDFVQVSRSNIDTIYDIAQSMACFKMSGMEWKQSLELEQRAIQFCSSENVRLKSTGAFADVLLQRGSSEDRAQNRYNNKSGGK